MTDLFALIPRSHPNHHVIEVSIDWRLAIGIGYTHNPNLFGTNWRAIVLWLGPVCVLFNICTPATP